MYSTLAALVLGLSALLPACVGNDDFTTGDEDNIVEDQTTSGESAVLRFHTEALRGDGKLDEVEVARLAVFLKDVSGKNASVKTFLQKLVDEGPGKFKGGARELLQQFVAGQPVGWAGLDNAVFRLEIGKDANVVSDDEIFVKGDGEISGTTGIIGHSRGYAKIADGVLRISHGSKAPAFSKVSTAAETKKLNVQGPHVALDLAAQVYGVDLGTYTFQHLGDKVHYDPKAPYWAGLCHAWSYTALDPRLDVLVDVQGPAGQRGLWIFGQWLSRADLGNWMMGVANHTSISDAVLVDSFVRPEDWIKGITQYVMNSGKGLRADVWNDAESGATSEIWNQPFYSASVNVTSVDAAARDAVYTYAMSDKSSWTLLPPAPSVKLMQVKAQWGAEVADNHEGATATHTSTWNIYVVLDDKGRVARGYMAHHLAAAKITGLPTVVSDPLPDYFAYPKHAAVDAALNQTKNFLLDGGLEGKHYRFFVGTVLARGIPNEMRKAFETDFFGGMTSAALLSKYPGIANAYSPAQWTKVFAPKLGAGEAFGAAWGKAARDFSFSN